MSLALVQVSTTDFNTIYSHIASHRPQHANMHLRQARQPKSGRVLRYLHAMRAVPGTREIDGMISGPGIFWQYRLVPTNGLHTQVQVLAHRSPPRDARRIQHRFLKEILDRVTFEKQGTVHHPKYKSGQFYLRRCVPGMRSAHVNCQTAVSTGQLDQAFVAQIQAWNFELLHP